MKDLNIYLSKKSLSLENGSPLDRTRTGFESVCVTKFLSALFVLFFLGIGNAWGDTYSWTLTTTDFGTTASPATTLSSKGSPAKNWSASYTWSKNKYIGTSLDGTRGAQVGAKPDNSSNNRHVTSLVLSTSGISGTISVVTVHTAGAKGTNATIGVSVGGTTFKYEGNNTASLTKDDASYSFTGSSSGTITITWSQSSTLALYVKSIEVTYSAAATCSNDPSVGAASLNGSFNMTSTTSSIGVSSGTCSTGNAACDWTDYGFVWSDGANTTTPTVGGTNCNKVKVGESGTSTSWTGSITPSGSTTPTSWTTGHTYYVRTYGKNSKTSASYYYSTTAWTFTPYSVTFYKNDGGATTSTQYVQGGVSTPLTSNSFSRTGYTFNGWNTDADGTSGTGYTNGQSVSLSANLTLYAKWSAKQAAITFDKNDGTGGDNGTTATYGSAMSTVTVPTRTGYDFDGYYDAETDDNGSGNKYYNSDGTSAANWNKDTEAATTLYAKWTVKNYSVTWKVNNTDYSTGTPTDNVNHGSKVTKLPTAPDPASYCGDKFMGWTDATDGAYVHGTSNLYTKASQFPAATGNQVFYAVFADYDD